MEAPLVPDGDQTTYQNFDDEEVELTTLKHMLVERYRSPIFEKFCKKVLRQSESIQGLEEEKETDAKDSFNVQGVSMKKENPNQTEGALRRDTDIFTACENGDKETIQNCISRLGKQSGISFCRDVPTQTPLLHACWFANATAVDLILESVLDSLDTEHKSEVLGQAMVFSCQTRRNSVQNRLRVIKCLISHGADTTYQDQSGDTCLHWLVREPSQPLLVKYLICHTPLGLPQVHIRNLRGNTALDVAYGICRSVWGSEQGGDYSIRRCINLLKAAQNSRVRLQLHSMERRDVMEAKSEASQQLKAMVGLVSVLRGSPNDALYTCETILRQLEEERKQSQDLAVADAVAEARKDFQNRIRDPEFFRNDLEFRHIHKQMRKGSKKKTSIEITQYKALKEYEKALVTKAKEDVTVDFQKSYPTVNLKQELDTLAAR